LRKRKNPMQPLGVRGIEYQCSNAHVWPPLEIEVYGGTAQDLRYVVDDLVYQRVKTWEQVCGLMLMSENKCPTCPFVLIDGKPLREPGTGKVNRIHTKRSIKMSTLTTIGLEGAGDSE